MKIMSWMKAPHNVGHFRYEFGYWAVGIESIVIAKPRMIQNVRENMIFRMNHNISCDKNCMEIHPTLYELENKQNIAFTFGAFAVRKPFVGTFAAEYFQMHAATHYAVHQKFSMTSCKSIADETISFDVSRTIECGGNI